MGMSLGLNSSCIVAGLVGLAASICMVALPVSAAEDSVVTKAGYEPMKPTADMQMWFYTQERKFRYPVPAEFEFAYIDKSGKVVINGPFCQAKPFRNGIAPLQIGTYEFSNGKWGLGDLSIHRGVPAFLFPDGTIKRVLFSGLLPEFYSDLAVVDFSEQAAGEPGGYRHSKAYIDKDGNRIVFKKDWLRVGVLSEGLLSVTDQDYAALFNGRTGDDMRGWHYLDRTGNEAIAKRFAAANRFSEGLAAVSDGGPVRRFTGIKDLRFYHGLDYYYINKSGAKAIEGPFFEAGVFSEGLAAVMTESGKWGYVDKTGKMVVQSQFDWAGEFVGSLAPVEKDMLVGFIDKNGRQVIPFKFKDAKEFGEELAPATLDGRHWGYIDKTGEFIIKPIFQRAFPFSSGRGLVYTDVRSAIVPARSEWLAILKSIYHMRSSGKFNEARAVCLEIIKNEPGSDYAKTATMHLETGLTDHEVSSQAMAEYIAGVHCSEADSLEEARSHFNKAIELDPEVPAFYGALAYTFLEKKEYQELVEILEKMLAKHGKYARGYWRLSKAYEGLGDKTRAAQNLARAKSLDPEDPYFKD